MANYTFPSNSQGWDEAVMPWTIADGSPSLGCLRGAGGGSFSTGLSELSIPVAVDDPISCRVRFTAAEDANPGTLRARLRAQELGGDLADIIEERSVLTLPYDSGWFIVSGVFTGTGTVDALAFNAHAVEAETTFDVAFDFVYVAESPPGGFTFTRSAGGVPGAVAI